jgi:integrase/recombinase XerD
MVARRPRAPWGRIRKDGRDLRWSLETDDPKVAAERYKAGKSQLIAVRRGDARLIFHSVVEDWGTHWLQRNKSAKTVRRYLCSIDQLAPFLEGKTLSEIDGKLVADIIRARAKTGVTNATIKRDLVAVSSVMNYAIGQGWLEINPILPRMKLLEERRDPIVLPVKDAIDLVIERSPGMIADLIRTAVATGAREEELITARRDHVDHARKQLTVTGKRNKRRTIDLEPFGGYDLIGTLPACGPWLFWHSDGENYKNFASQFAAIVGRTTAWAVANNVPFRPFRFHDLRHLHAVNWLKDGHDICATATPRAHQHQDDRALLRVPHARGGYALEGLERAQNCPHRAKWSDYGSSRKPCVAMVRRGGRVAEGGGLLNRYTV